VRPFSPSGEQTSRQIALSSLYALPYRLSHRREGDWRSLAREEYCSNLPGRWRWKCAGNIVPGSDCFCRLNSILCLQRNRQGDRPQRTLVSPLKSWNQGLYSSIEAATVMRRCHGRVGQWKLRQNGRLCPRVFPRSSSVALGASALGFKRAGRPRVPRWSLKPVSRPNWLGNRT